MTDFTDKLCVLGGGLSGLSFVHFCGMPAVVIEKEDRLGGLCRSLEARGLRYDIGPHIFFSKNKKALDFLTSLAPMHQRRRSNKILYRGSLVKYPFENDLAALPPADRDWCLQSFLHNPYADYDADNMLMFFYKTFGEGITRAYLEPYNRKIWKFEPSFMDTQMVERIPKPPAEDVIASAEGTATEGYTHQLYFSYPDQGGTESIINGLVRKLGSRLKAVTGAPLERLRVLPGGGYEVTAGGRAMRFEHLVTAMPVHELLPLMDPAPPEDVARALAMMRYNSIHISLVNVSVDNYGDNYAIMQPDMEVSFHRLSRPDFLGDAYGAPGGVSLMAEITFRAGDRWDMPPDDVTARVIADLIKSGFIQSEDQVNFADTRSFKYAYVIYDSQHRRNTDKVLAWLESLGIHSVGRFAAFEYINMDACVDLAEKAAQRFLEAKGLGA